MNLKFKNIIYPLSIFLLTFFFYFFFILFVSLPFSSLTILDLNIAQSWIFWLSFFILYSFLIFTILYFDSKKNESKDYSIYFKLVFVFIFINAFLALLPMLIFISLTNYEKGVFNNTIWISFIIFIYFLIIWFSLVFYFNLIISIGLKEDKILQIINHNIWFFIFHNLSFNKKDKYLYEIKFKKANIVFGCYFIDEIKKINKIQFSDQVKFLKKEQSDEKIYDLFNDISDQKIENQKEEIRSIESDQIAKISIDYLKENQSNYFIYLNNNFENLITQGKVPEKVIIINEKNFLNQFRRLLKKVKK
ncbi:hypothetical protein X271_00116 [Candidatus Hepatoplasma crinochetorum Av]|uniref:Transmembrane protein n=1 Tax=Candidatus Hepatoplasma crinochetorum Av TaxID=1427984 RepID=W8GS11_9MOLU|nr:hypothetical protein [Candidatus Hepatoplasma crinochetorum]AHK22225.1 hypothetical protein X271_00116 [Candidatus Hepatoplasma crinochetorum Av]